MRAPCLALGISALLPSVDDDHDESDLRAACS